jgi:hypothetical protein
MHSHLAHAHCSVARGLNTRAHILPHSPRRFILDSGTTDPAPSTCILSALRLNSTAAHFSPHTRPPDMQVGLECLGSLVNSYLPGLRSIPRARSPELLLNRYCSNKRSRVWFCRGPWRDFLNKLHCRWNAIATQSIGIISVQARGILPRPEEQSRSCGCQSGSVEDQPQCPGL